MTATDSLGGVLPVFQTPYLDDDSIDWTTLEREIDWLLASGASGVVMAMVSEVLRLDDAERREMAEKVVQFAGSNGKVIISVGAESSRTAVANTRHAAQCGAAAVMAIPPISIATLESELFDYYANIVHACELPVIVQDASGYVGRPMSIAMQAQLLDAFGADRIRFKPEAAPIGQRLSALRDATEGRARIYEGTGGIALLDSYRRGIVGTMPGADLIHGIVALWRALETGQDEQAYALSQTIAALVSMQNSLDAFLAVEKHLLVRQGIFLNTRVRGPVGYQLDDETKREVDRLFDQLAQASGLL
ncbi:MAG: dihydrodipicolinate synthase family protein [Aureliella sp.]